LFVDTKNWIPAFAGMTETSGHYWDKPGYDGKNIIATQFDITTGITQEDL